MIRTPARSAVVFWAWSVVQGRALTTALCLFFRSTCSSAKFTLAALLLLGSLLARNRCFELNDPQAWALGTVYFGTFGGAALLLLRAAQVES